MRPSRSSVKAPTPALPPSKTTSSNSSTSQEPPAKKPRLKLNLRKPSSNDGDTIAVSRPKRASAGRRYSEEVVVSDDEVEEVTEVKQSPAASSGLSSPISAPAPVKEEAVATDAKVGGRDSYGDFFSYYVADSDNVEEETASKPKRKKKEKPEKQQRKPRAKKVPTPPLSQPVDDRPQKPSQPPQSPQSRPRPRHNRQPNNLPVPRPVAIPPPTHPTDRSLPAPVLPQVQPSMPPPRPIIEPPIIEEITVKYHASVPEKVKKLQALSTALTNFGGVQGTAKQAVPEESKKAEGKKPQKPSTCLFHP